MELRIPYALMLLLTRRLDRNFVTSRLSSGFQSNLIRNGTACRYVCQIGRTRMDMGL